MSQSFGVPQIIAALDNQVPNYQSIWSPTMSLATATMSRQEALTVPAVARARNIICATIGSLPLGLFDANTGRRLNPIPLQYQPDPASPKAVTYSWLADSLLMYGVGYLQVVETYKEDGRPSRMRWIDPLRVLPQLDTTGFYIVGYNVDGAPVPSQGKGSLIAFQGLDEGLLKRAGRTIRTAVELEQAALRAAEEPTPQTVLKNSGVDLPADKVTDLLAKWKIARREKATAYLSNGIDLEAVGFDPRAQQLVEARQFHASEIARAVGIPAWYLNAEAATMTYSNVTSERRALIDFSLRPIMTAIEERLSMPDVIARGVAFRFELDNFLRGNPLDRVEVITRLLEAGVIDVNEARAMEDMAPRGNENA